MPADQLKVGVWISIALATSLAHAHMAAWTNAMYALNGTVPGLDNLNNNGPVAPLYNLPYKKFWMHNVDGTPNFPPPEGHFVELPAGGSFTVEIAENRAFTSLHPNAHLTPWGDGQNHPDNYSITNLGGLKPTTSGCIPSPNIHAQNEAMAAGTAWAISYESDISKVTPNDFTVFTVRHNTPWLRECTYDVPSCMPPCPEEGCLIVWLWVPNGCGQRNMYMYPHRAKVIPDSKCSSSKTIGTPKPPSWCEDDQSKCVQGPKEMIIFNQLEDNNIFVEGNDMSGYPKTPVYNEKCGFKDGAQNDIFVDSLSQLKRMKRHAKKNIF